MYTIEGLVKSFFITADNGLRNSLLHSLAIGGVHPFNELIGKGEDGLTEQRVSEC